MHLGIYRFSFISVVAAKGGPAPDHVIASPIRCWQVRCYRLVTAGTVEERIVAAAQNKLLMNALVMRDAPNGAGGGGGGGGGLGGGAAPRLSVSDLLQAVVDGCHCVNSVGGGGGDGEQLREEDIDALLDRAEADTDVEGNTTQAGAGNQSAAKEAAAGLNNADTAMKNADAGHAQAGPPSGTAEEAGRSGAQAALARVFRSLPAIREFEGRDYSRKLRPSESAAAFRGLAAAWERDNRPAAREAGGGDAARPAAAAAAAAAAPSGRGMLHRRRCQGCMREVGAMLFCSRCVARPAV